MKKRIYRWDIYSRAFIFLEDYVTVNGLLFAVEILKRDFNITDDGEILVSKAVSSKTNKPSSVGNMVCISCDISANVTHKNYDEMIKFDFYY